MTTWSDSIPTINADAPPFYRENVDFRNVAAGLDHDPKHVCYAVKRRKQFLLKIADAARHMATLPADRASYHIIMRGN